MAELTFNALRDRLRRQDADIAALRRISSPAVFRPYTPVLSSTGVQPVLGDGTISGSWTRQGDLVTVDNLTFSFGTIGVTIGTGTYQLSLPVLATSTGPCGRAWLNNNGVLGYPVDAFLSSSVVYFMQPAWAQVTAVSPFAFGVSDGVYCGTITYRAP